MSRSHRLRRILVSLDASPHGLAALEAAANLAALVGAELQGLFVEDVNLLRLAALPFAREIEYTSGTSRPLDLPSMEFTLRERAEGVRRALEAAATPASLRWSFTVKRGEFARATLAASEGADLLVLGRECVSPSGRFGDRGKRGPILAVFDESTSARAVLEMAAQLASQREEDVILLVVGAGNPQVLEAFASNRPIYLQQIKTSEPNAIVEATRQWGAGALLIPKSPLFDEVTIDALVAQLECPIGIVCFDGD